MGQWETQVCDIFIHHFLVPQSWDCAVVVMDNLPAHKLTLIEALIEAGSATVLNLSTYSQDFIDPRELWWLQLKSFLGHFSTTTTTPG